MSVKVLITRLDPSVPLPAYAKPGDAGADLVTRIDVTIKPGERVLVPTGISLALPKGYVALVHPQAVAGHADGQLAGEALGRDLIAARGRRIQGG